MKSSTSKTGLKSRCNKAKQDGVLREKTRVSGGRQEGPRKRKSYWRTVFLGQHDDRLEGRSTFSRNGK